MGLVNSVLGTKVKNILIILTMLLLCGCMGLRGQGLSKDKYTGKEVDLNTLSLTMTELITLLGKHYNYDIIVKTNVALDSFGNLKVKTNARKQQLYKHLDDICMNAGSELSGLQFNWAQQYQRRIEIIVLMVSDPEWKNE